VDTIVARLVERAARNPDVVAFMRPSPEPGGPWTPVTWGEALGAVREIGAGLVALGIKAGDRVALIGKNSPEWLAVDFAVQHIGAITVPLYTTFAPEQLEYVVNHAGCRAYVFDEPQQWERIRVLGVPTVEQFVSMDPTRGEGYNTLDQLRETGRTLLDERPDALETRLLGVKPEDPFSIIYTSGTTGPPKGAVLTHRNALWTADRVGEAVPFGGSETTVCYLPLSHVYERLSTTVVPFAEDGPEGTIYFVPEMERLPEALVAARPTIFASVPRVWEKVRARVLAQVEADPRRAKAVGKALAAGMEAARRRDTGERIPMRMRFRAWMARNVVGRKVRRALGLDRVRWSVCGAAPISLEVQRFVQALGIPLHQGWGMTETTSAGLLQADDDLEAGVVGIPLDGVQIRLDDDGEILIRGDNVFAGYYREPEATGAVLSEDGWFRTGDIGAWAEDGRLKIVDRKKDLIITSAGKNIGPQEIEKRLKADPWIGEAMVVGDGRPYLVALLSLDPYEALEPPDSTGVVEHLAAAVDEVNLALSRPEQVKKWFVAPGGFPADALTPTLKLKRRVVLEAFAAEIESLYE
jgi:long-chain acyl-CoA synthetase